MSYDLQLNQAQMRTFVMVNPGLVEVAGLGGTFTLNISKAGGAFAPSAGVKAEIGNGWYAYTFTAGETDTVGPLSVRVTGAGCIQQNLEYIVRGANVGCIDFTYTLTNSVTGLPIEGATIWISSDIAGANIIWSGITDVNGIARNIDDDLPCLMAGTYYFWRHKVGFTFVDPDTEIVS